mmetsp:Transcript_5530/g.13322  ORF Transcript_5530/g.13322 Transcript_5530/m.13322 type:complete len:535 (+) Transcript_5530:370-1974(+)
MARLLLPSSSILAAAALVAATAATMFLLAAAPSAVVSATTTTTTTTTTSYVRSSRSVLLEEKREEEEEQVVPTSQRRSLQSLTNETSDFVSGPQVNQDRFVDFVYCYGALKRHDVDGNGRVEQPEYLAFVQDLGRNTECLGDLQELPIELMSCWNQLSCECRARGGAPECCEGSNAHIPISGSDVLSEQMASGQGLEFIVEEQQFLRQTCLRTDQCVIAFCGVPPPPVVPPPPLGVVVPPPPPPPPASTSQPLWWLFFLLLLIPLCCCRRRWWFVAGPPPKPDDESSASSESEIDEEIPGGGARHLMTEEEGPPPVALAAIPALAAAPDDGDPDANRVALRSQDIDEDGGGGGVAYSRSVQEPEYEEDPVPPGPKVIDQFDPPQPPQDDMALRHVEKPPPPPPVEDPYALEKYTPDGGIVEYEREGEWNYDADGGWTPDEKAAAVPKTWNRHKYDREEDVEPVVVDRRKDRHLDGLSGGAIFDMIGDDEEDVAAAAPTLGKGADMFSWVIDSTLTTLDQKQDDLRSDSGRGGED